MERTPPPQVSGSYAPAPLSVVVASPKKLDMAALCSLVADGPTLRIAGGTSRVEQVGRLLLDISPQVLVIEESMWRKMDAIIRESLTGPGKIGVVVLSAQVTGREKLSDAVYAVSKDIDGEQFQDIVREVGLLGNVPKQRRGRRKSGLLFSAREEDVISLLAQGYSNREIAQKLNLTEQSVKNVISRVLSKKGYRNRVQVVLDYWQIGQRS